MSETTKAVFLSYASQDAEAARHICNALTTAGVEVWFDQSELKGGDAWDHQIRQRIRDCALFVPIISANTASRPEGYFRLEWALAEQRSDMIARNKTFIVPVCIDTIPNQSADVPESFARVQWTRLPDGEPSPAFVDRVSGLLSAGASTAVPLLHTPALSVSMVSRASPAADKPSIAVLPFANMSGDPDQDYFADGMVEDIITALSRFNQLFVIARNSSFTYKGRTVDIRQVSRELSVRYVLEGSVRRSGNRLRITGQLIDASIGSHLWADRFDGDLENVFELQDKITEKVIGAIEPTIKKAEIERARRKPTENLDAYDLYLRALPLVHAFRPADNLAALSLLHKAIALDPHYAPALGYAAWAYEQRIVRVWTPAGDDDAGTAVALARRILATGTDDAVALVLAGFVFGVVARDWDTGLDTCRRALARNAGSGFVNLMGSLSASFGGAPEEGLVLAERAMMLSPLDPAFFLHLLAGAFAHLFCGRPQQALDLAQRSVSVYPDWDTTFWILIACYVQLDRLPEARDALAKLLVLTPGLTISRISCLSYRNPKSIAMLTDGVRAVGLPE